MGRDERKRNTLAKGEQGELVKGEKGLQRNHAEVQSFQNSPPRYFIHTGLEQRAIALNNKLLHSAIDPGALFRAVCSKNYS